MVRRHAKSAVAPSAYVFPGGTIRDDDLDLMVDDRDALARAISARSDTRVEPDQAAALYVCAARELFEEAGVLLARSAGGAFVSLAGADDHARFKDARHHVHDGKTTLRAIVEREHLRLALDALVLFAHWVTPPIDTRQFDTRFFMTRVPPRQTPAHDETETTHSAWIRPADAIAQAIVGDIVLPPPTWTTLREVEPFGSVEQALAWARTREIVRRMPRMLENGERRVLVLPGDPLHPDPGGAHPPVETRFVLVDRRWRVER